MGKLIGGPFGQMHGKVGKLVSYKLLGKDVVRVVGEHHHPPSDLQLDCRLRLKVLAQVQKPIKAFLDIGFRYEATLANKYPGNLASAYNYRYAMTGAYPDIGISFPLIRVAQGSLPDPIHPEAEWDGEGLRFTWETGNWMDFDERRHRAMLMAYFPELQRATFILDGATRYEGEAYLPIAENLRTACMETYLAFSDMSTGKAANSVYTGAFNSV